MERCPDIGFDSYDRFFPSQDTLPIGGFGNLIALPLQKGPREGGNSLFVDDDLRPYADQWAFLSTIRRMPRSEVMAITEAAAVAGRIVGVRLPSDDDDDEPWTAPPSRRRPEPPISGELPKQVTIVLGNQIYVPSSRPCQPADPTRRFPEPRVLRGSGDAASNFRQAAHYWVRRVVPETYRVTAGML